MKERRSIKTWREEKVIKFLSVTLERGRYKEKKRGWEVQVETKDKDED